MPDGGFSKTGPRSLLSLHRVFSGKPPGLIKEGRVGKFRHLCGGLWALWGEPKQAPGPWGCQEKPGATWWGLEGSGGRTTEPLGCQGNLGKIGKHSTHLSDLHTYRPTHIPPILPTYVATFHTHLAFALERTIKRIGSPHIPGL